MGILLVFLLFFIWSSVFPLGKMALETCPPIFLTGVRMALAGALLLGYLAIRKQIPRSLTGRQWMALGLMAFLNIYLVNVLEFWSLVHLTPAKVCFLYSLSPFLTALFSYIHFNEKMTRTKWIGMGIGFLGFLPIILFTKTPEENLLQTATFFSWPELAMIGAVICSVYGWILLRMTVKNDELSPFFANGASMLLGGIFGLITSFFVDGWATSPIAPGKFLTFTGLVLSITFISSIVCYNLYGYLLRRYTATILSFCGLLSPVFASLHSWILTGETPSLTILCSTAILLLGLWIIYRTELAQGYIQTIAPRVKPENDRD